MATGKIASRLHPLISRCIIRYAEGEVNSPTNETEKDLLLSLSQVLREIQSWIRDRACDSAVMSSLEAGEKAFDHEDESAGALYGPESKESLCLERFVATLVGLLGMRSVYVKHLTGNILVEVSNCLAKSVCCVCLTRDLPALITTHFVSQETQWDDFIRLLCECLRLAVIYSCPGPAVSSATASHSQCPGIHPTHSFRSCIGTGSPDAHFLGSDVLKCELKKASWSMVSDIFRILRNILKRLSQEENEELLDLYLESVNSTLAQIPWCRVDTIFSHQHGNGERNSQGQKGNLGSTANSEEATVFLGRFVQFLCSVVQQAHVAEDSDGFEPTHLILQKTIALVPDLLRWCQPKLESHSGSICMSRYLVHKLLVLMIRLTYQSNIKCTILLSWLQYLQSHFQGFFQQTLATYKPAQDNCLEGSPFYVSLSDREVNETHSNHLQRLSVFLFLRCSFILLYSSRHTNKHCEYNCRKKGVKEIFKWIEQQIPGDIFSDHRTYTLKSVDFTASFVRLFMHEDDLLFKVLLQLLSVALHREELLNLEGSSLQDEEQTILYRLSILFNPVILFCIFLSELHYDHEVLLDYLISKDIGPSCAEYLLRCLRAVCDSWAIFVEFPFEGSTCAYLRREEKVCLRFLRLKATGDYILRLLKTPKIVCFRYENQLPSYIRRHYFHTTQKLFYDVCHGFKSSVYPTSNLSGPKLIPGGRRTRCQLIEVSTFQINIQLIGSQLELHRDPTFLVGAAADEKESIMFLPPQSNSERYKILWSS